MKKYIRSATQPEINRLNRYGKYIANYVNSMYPEAHVTYKLHLNDPIGLELFTTLPSTRGGANYKVFNLRDNPWGTGLCLDKDVDGCIERFLETRIDPGLKAAGLSDKFPINSVDRVVQQCTDFHDFDDYFSTMAEFLIPGDQLVEFLQTQFTGDPHELEKFAYKLVYSTNYDELEEQGLANSKPFLNKLQSAILKDITDYADDQGYPWSDGDN